MLTVIVGPDGHGGAIAHHVEQPDQASKHLANSRRNILHQVDKQDFEFLKDEFSSKQQEPLEYLESGSLYPRAVKYFTNIVHQVEKNSAVLQNVRDCIDRALRDVCGFPEFSEQIILVLF